MKFEKFVKKAMPHATTLLVDKENYLAYGHVFAKIPGWAGTLGIPSDKTGTLRNILDNWEWGTEEAELSSAYLPAADSKAKDIIREFSDGGESVGVTNEEFALIEKHDMLVIATDDVSGNKALLIGKRASLQDFEPEAIILDVEFKEDHE